MTEKLRFKSAMQLFAEPSPSMRSSLASEAAKPGSFSSLIYAKLLLFILPSMRFDNEHFSHKMLFYVKREKKSR